jgi:Xaa-Pro aminopeptidase
VCSFATIAGVGPNGAIIHYKPEDATAAPLTLDHMFLLDSGAQYLDGTTDVTRTVSPVAPLTICLAGQYNLGTED